MATSNYNGDDEKPGGPGELEIIERVPGRVAISWKFAFRRTQGNGSQKLEAPLFWFKDSSGDRHSWNMIFYGAVSADIDRLKIQHSGSGKTENSTFTIKSRVTEVNEGNDVPGQCYYDDVFSEGTCQDFFKTPEHSIDISGLPKIPNQCLRLKVFCIIIAVYDIIGQERHFLTQHESFLLGKYELLFESGEFSDVSFIVDKQKIRVHKSILSSRSPVFAAMFRRDFEENITNEVKIDDQTYEVMREFFRYVYAARVNNIEEHAIIQLLITSDKYQVDGLKSLCEQRLISVIQNKNALEYLNLANRYNTKDLETKCLVFIASNAKELVKLPEFSINKVPEDLRDELFKLLAERPEYVIKEVVPVSVDTRHRSRKQVYDL